MTPLGYPAESPAPKPRKPLSQLVYREKFVMRLPLARALVALVRGMNHLGRRTSRGERTEVDRNILLANPAKNLRSIPIAWA